MQTFFISDLHLGHKKCLSFGNRKFTCFEDYNKNLIKRWNNAVNPLDSVWILGDISWYSPEETVEIISRLNGRKNLVTGNHDKHLIQDESVHSLFEEIVDYKELYFDKKTAVVLSHYPIPFYNRQYHGWYHLYGHIHTNREWELLKLFQKELWEEHQIPCNMYNVGCMVQGMDFTPRTLEEILDIFGCV